MKIFDRGPKDYTKLKFRLWKNLLKNRRKGVKIRGVYPTILILWNLLNCSFEWETWRTKLRIARYKIGQLLFETRNVYLYVRSVGVKKIRGNIISPMWCFKRRFRNFFINHVNWTATAKINLFISRESITYRSNLILIKYCKLKLKFFSTK